MNELQAKEMISLLKQIWYKLDSINEALADMKEKPGHDAIPENVQRILNDINHKMNSGK